MSTQSKIYDHIAGKFIDINSEQGKQIAKINKLCEKCNADKIYNPSTKRCVSIKGSNADIYKNEIDYCKKYYEYKMKNLNNDIKVFDNILNIKIPKKFVKNNKSFLIKDIFEKNLLDSQEKSLAAKLNIKDVKYKKYINYLPALIYSIYQVLSMNPNTRDYLISNILSILRTVKGGIMALYIKVCIEYLNTPYLINILSGFSFSKFFVFITGIIVVLTNLPSKLLGNKYSVRRISDVALGDNRTNPALANVKPLNTDTYKPIVLDEAQQSVLSKLNAYNNYDKTVNLSKLGINIKEAADPNTKMSVNYDDNVQMPYVELLNRNGKKSYWIFPNEVRSKKINEIKNKTIAIIKELDSKRDEIIDIRENHSAYLKSLKLQDNVQEITEELGSIKKFTPAYNKSSKKLETLQKELTETKKYLTKKKYIPLNPVELTVLQPKLTSISQWKSTVTDLYKYTKRLDNSNINVYYPTMMQTLEAATNFVKSVDQLNIVVPVQKGVTPNIHFTQPIVPTSVIQNNLNTVNSQLVAANNISTITKTAAGDKSILKEMGRDIEKSYIINKAEPINKSILEEMGIGSSTVVKKAASPQRKTKMIDLNADLEQYDSMSGLKELLNSEAFDPNKIADEEIAINLKAFDTNPNKKVFKMRNPVQRKSN